MMSKVEQTPNTPSKLLHETVDQLSTIISIAQFSLISEDMSPKLGEDMNRIIQAARNAADHIKHLGEIFREEE
jgi:Na+/phosphate symporter